MIGILPAAGQATRIHGLPKYLLPIPGDYLLKRHVARMQHAGIGHIAIGTNPLSCDIISDCELDAGLYIAHQRATMTQTVLSSKVYRNEYTVFGMPDTYIEDAQVYQRLVERLHYGADVVVALFEARPGQHREGGMCTVTDERVVAVIDKPDEPPSPYIWGALAWSPAFWDYLKPEDPHVGYGLPTAIAAGLQVHAVQCTGGFWDCGTPDRYFSLIRHLTEPEHVLAHRP